MLSWCDEDLVIYEIYASKIPNERCISNLYPCVGDFSQTNATVPGTGMGPAAR